jgi:hypothetical protein
MGIRCVQRTRSSDRCFEVKKLIVYESSKTQLGKTQLGKTQLGKTQLGRALAPKRPCLRPGWSSEGSVEETRWWVISSRSAAAYQLNTSHFVEAKVARTDAG